MTWRQCTEEEWDYALGVLPPAVWLAYGFLLGEPHDHRTCTVRGHVAPTYAAFVNLAGKYYSGPHLTEMEFRKLDLKTVTGGDNADQR